MLLLFSNTNTTSSSNRGKLRVRIGTDWLIKTVKVWDGSNWVQKPVRYWTGSKWAFTFDVVYTLYEDTGDSGFFIGNGATEDSTDSGFYQIQGSAAREDTNEPGTYIIGG